MSHVAGTIMQIKHSLFTKHNEKCRIKQLPVYLTKIVFFYFLPFQNTIHRNKLVYVADVGRIRAHNTDFNALVYGKYCTCLSLCFLGKH